MVPIVVVLAVIGTLRFLPTSSPVAGPTLTGTTTTTAPATSTPTPSPTPPPLAALRLRATTIKTPTEGFFSWALMDRRTGQIWGSSTMTGTTWPASMIKAWLAADYLRRLQENGQTLTTARANELETLIRDSSNEAADDFWVLDGRIASHKRLISMCKLTDSTPSSAGWSFIKLSARDTVRMADCIGDGTAGGSKYTPKLLQWMRGVRGEGDFGIRKAFPAAEAAQVSIKNGWLFYDDDKNWHINCMALTDTWALAVLQRYPGHGKYNSDYQRGRNVCRDVTTELLNPDYVPTA